MFYTKSNILECRKIVDKTEEMDNALARLLGQEPLESLDGPGKGI